MLRSVLLFLTLLCSLLTACGEKPQKPWSMKEPDEVTRRVVEQGAVVGGLDRAGGHAWLGIPYAAPPVGPLRWRAPQPPAKWEGARRALAFAPPCMQKASPIGGVPGEPGEAVGSEDCLYLNIYAPPFNIEQVPKKNARLPVMFWIHGGGNTTGTASFYDGGWLAKSQNVIVVTIQYRLGPFGWFRHKSLRAGTNDALEQSGNFGTLDQIAALHWVHDNISAFGGDPGNVTLFGESAGGSNVFALLLARPAAGLFHRAVVESGNVSTTSTADAEDFASDPTPGMRHSSNEAIIQLLVQNGLAKDRGAARARIEAMPDTDLAAYLRARDPVHVLAAYPETPGVGLIELPTLIHDGALLPEGDWVERFGDPQGWTRVPVLLGSNRDEFKLFMFYSPFYTRRLLDFPSMRNDTLYQATADYVSRSWKANAVDRPAAAMRRSGASAVFTYRFDWRDEPIIKNARLSEMLGAAHAFEIPFVFGHFDVGPQAKRLFEKDTGQRDQLSHAMMAYWAQFARTGAPGTGGRKDLPDWPAWDPTPGAPKYMVLQLASEGGLKLGVDVQTREQLIAEIDRDERFLPQVQKCRVFHQLALWTHAMTRDEFMTVGSTGCALYPFDEFPWPGKE